MSEFGDVIKKLNARLEVLERRGLTGTWEYQSLKTRISSVTSRNMTINANGYTYVSGRGLSKEQKKQLTSIANNKALTYTHAEKRLLQDSLSETGRTIDELSKGERRKLVKERGQMETDINNFISKYKKDIYEIEYFNALVKSGKALTKAQAKELINMYSSDAWKIHENENKIERYTKSRRLSADMKYTLDMLDSKMQALSKIHEQGKHNAQLEKDILNMQHEIQLEIMKK